MHSGAYFSRILRLTLVLSAALALMLVTSAGRLNLSYLTPDGHVAVDQALLTDTPLKVCALTFDDGPDEVYTQQVLAVLDDYGVKATFFVIGERAKKRPGIVQALARSGHELGNHSWSHADLTDLTGNELRDQLTKTNDELARLGIAPRWFRPPFGEFSPALLEQAAALKMDTILWSADPRDWSQPGVETISARVLRQTAPGAVILLHATNAQTVAALPAIIDGLSQRGYTFATLSQWRALVTGAAPPPPAGQLQYIPPKDSGLAMPHAAALEPFYQPRPPAGAEADALPITSVPRVVEQLENHTPADRGHLLWSWISANVHTAATGEAPAGRLVAEVIEPLPERRVPPPSAVPEDQLLVYANFSGAGAASRVFELGGTNGVQRFGPERQSLGSQPARRIDVMLGSDDWVKIEDTPVTPAAELPVLPEGEELVLPPLSEEPPPAAAGEPAAEEQRPAIEPEPAPRELPPVPLTIVDLVDMENPDTLWQPPAGLNAGQLLPYQPPRRDAGPFPEPSYYFLSMTGDLEHYTWVELKTYLRLARLSGLVLPDGWYSAPPADLPYPWTYSGPLGTDRSAWIDLTVEDIADVMEVLKRGKEQVYIVVRPSNLHFFIAAHTWAEMNTSMRDFVLFRQLTGGMELTPQPAIAADWQLPDGVELARFSDGGRESLVLYSQSYRAVSVTVPPSCRHMSRAFIDAGGYLKIAPLEEDSVSVDRSPAILYYEYPAD